MFTDRTDAGRQLASRLLGMNLEKPCVLALPRGGVPVGFEVAQALHAPLDLVLVRKIGAPFEPELALGAVVDGSRPELVINDPAVISSLGLQAYIERREAEELREIERRRRVYLGGRSRLDITGRTAIVVDDGIATGATMRAALHATRRAHPKRILLAVPVAPPDTLAELRAEADEIVCLETHADFWGIGAYYEDFTQLDDETVRAILDRCMPAAPAGA